ncbi:MAG: lipid-A-disaccharide synthase [Flavobacteriales bacterium]|jgi:lipid-A-disaccharide synthase
MKYFIISGEASGDLHGSNLLKELNLLDPNADVQCWGGELMEKQGAKVMKHYKELAFMGFWEVIKNLRTIKKNFKLCKEQIEDFNPDAVIFIDYPGFNLRMAKFVKEKAIPTLYYISPQVWAWKKNRVKKIKVLIDRMFVILPFEKPFYDQYDYPVKFVGHPLIDAVESFRKEAISESKFKAKHGLSDKKIIALLPGSRKQEIHTKLPIMLEAIGSYADYQFVVAGAPSQTMEMYAEFMDKADVKIIFNDTYNLLNNSFAALVTSGTATLETALFRVPQVVCYKTSAISYGIAKRIVTIKYISLVNLIQDQEIVKELIQGDLTVGNIKSEFDKIITDPGRQLMLDNYEGLISTCGGVGASRAAAEGMYNYLESRK